MSMKVDGIDIGRLHGRTVTLEVSLQHLLRKLEAKGVLSQPEVVSMLDDVVDALKTDPRPDVGGRGAAAVAVGGLYLPVGAGT